MLFLLMPGSGICRVHQGQWAQRSGVATLAHAVTATDGPPEVELSSFGLREPHTQPRSQKA